jgi:hypothetical protein
VLEWIKTHPLYDVLIAVGLFLVVYLLSSSGGSSGGATQVVQAGPSDAVQEAAIAASAQQASAQSALSAATITSQNQLADDEAKYQAEIDLGVTQGNVAEYTALQSAQAQVAQTQLQSSVAAKQADDALQLGTAQTAGQVSIANTQTAGQVSIANTAALTQAQIAAIQNSGQVAINQQNQRTQQTQIQASANALKEQLDADTSINHDNVGLQESLAGTAAGVINNQTSASASVSNNQIAAQLAAINIAAGVTNHTTDAQAGIENNAINTAGAVSLAQIPLDTLAQNEQYDVETNYLQHVATGLIPSGSTTVAEVKASQSGNTIGGVLSGVAGIIGNIGKSVAAGLTAV